MKYFMITTALSFVAASPALAVGFDTTLPSSVQYEIHLLVPEADLSGLTEAQYAQFVAMFAKSDNLRSGENPAGEIQVILASNN